MVRGYIGCFFMNPVVKKLFILFDITRPVPIVTDDFHGKHGLLMAHLPKLKAYFHGLQGPVAPLFSMFPAA
jgi:hypothetical protein